MAREGTEKAIQNNILDYLRTHPRVAFAWQHDQVPRRSRNLINRFRHAGMPDIIGLLRGGRCFFIEVKNEKGRLSEEQQIFLQLSLSAGAFAMVARSVEDVQRAFRVEGII